MIDEVNQYSEMLVRMSVSGGSVSDHSRNFSPILGVGQHACQATEAGGKDGPGGT